MTAANRRRQLVQTSVELAEKSGFASFTMRDVASAAGVSLGTLQYFFPSKDGLIREVALALADQVAQVASALPEVSSHLHGLAALEELLNQAVEGWWTIISATPSRRLVTYEIATGALRSGGDVESTALTQYRLNTEYVTAMIAGCADLAGVTWAADIDDIGLFAMNYLDGYVLRWLLERDSPHLSSQRRLLVRAIVAFAEGDEAPGTQPGTTPE